MTLRQIACAISEAVVDFFAHPLTVLVLIAKSAGSLIWWLVAPSMVSATFFLSVLAIMLGSAVLFVQNRSEAAMHAKLSELVRAVPEADSGLADLERTEP